MPANEQRKHERGVSSNTWWAPEQLPSLAQVEATLATVARSKPPRINKNVTPSATTSDSTARSRAITFGSCRRLEEANRGDDLAGGRSTGDTAVRAGRGSSPVQPTNSSQSAPHRRRSCGRRRQHRNQRRTNRPEGGKQSGRSRNKRKRVDALVAGSFQWAPTCKIETGLRPIK
jgi:hypothetical protein